MAKASRKSPSEHAEFAKQQRAIFDRGDDLVDEAFDRALAQVKTGGGGGKPDENA